MPVAADLALISGKSTKRGSTSRKNTPSPKLQPEQGIKRSSSSSVKTIKVERVPDDEEKLPDSQASLPKCPQASHASFFKPKSSRGSVSRRSSLKHRKVSPSSEPEQVLFNGTWITIDQIRLANLKQLLLHIVYGQKDLAETLIKADPELLFYSGPIIQDYSKRRIRQTPYQMALSAGDLKLKFKKTSYKESMVEMIKRYLKQLPNGAAELLKQKKEVFPEGYCETFNKKIVRDSQALQKAFSDIREAKTSDDAMTAFQEFKDYLEPQEGEIITIGRHFNPYLLVEAYALYDEHFYQKTASFPNLPCGKSSINAPSLWLLLIGYIQRYLPACEAMAFSQGLLELVEGKKKFERNLKLGCNSGEFYPLDSDMEKILGANCLVGEAITSNWDYSTSFITPRQASELPTKCRNCYQEYSTQKEEALEEHLLQENELVSDNSCTNKCLIM